MPVCVLFVSNRSGIVFKLSTGLITDHSQSAKNVYRYFKSKLYVDDPGHKKSILILPNGLSKLGERAYDSNKFLPLMEYINIIIQLRRLYVLSPSNQFG